MANAKPLVTSPPTRNRIRIVRNTVNEVMIVRLSVSLIARLITDALSAPVISRLSSRIRSYTITVSFIEKPITVDKNHRFGKRCHSGDPVECATGNLVETQTDLAVPGLGPGLILSRTYSAQNAAASAPSRRLSSIERSRACT